MNSMYSSVAVNDMPFVKKKNNKKPEKVELPFCPDILSCSSLKGSIMPILRRKYISWQVYIPIVWLLADDLWFISLNQWFVWDLMEARVLCLLRRAIMRGEKLLKCHLLTCGNLQSLIQGRETKHILKCQILCLPTTYSCTYFTNLHLKVQPQEQSLIWPELHWGEWNCPWH